VIASTEPQSALRILATEPVSLVVLSDGFDAQARLKLVREMKTIKAHVPIVLLAKEKDELSPAVGYDAVVAWGAKEEFVEVLQRLA
jgi:PleD family two-component response regulator